MCVCVCVCCCVFIGQWTLLSGACAQPADPRCAALPCRYVCALQELWDSHKDKFAPDRKGELRLVE